jgi:predicted membrane-bound dolichyl-phosphate-mannose-protein mannosyltransferase
MASGFGKRSAEKGAVRRIVRVVWRRRRWIYAAWMLLVVIQIPARTGFRLAAPICDWTVTFDNLVLSLTKVPHIVLFGAFFFLTLVQFDRVERTSLGLSLMATAAISIIVEIQQGATRTGNCRITDVAPNILGGLIAAAFAMVAVTVWRRLTREPSTDPGT